MSSIIFGIIGYVITPLIAVLALIGAIRTLILTIQAENRLSSLLAGDEQLQDIKQRFAASMVDKEAVDEAQQHIERLMTALDEKYQRQLRENLSRLSERNRTRYITKLVTENM